MPMQISKLLALATVNAKVYKKCSKMLHYFFSIHNYTKGNYNTMSFSGHPVCCFVMCGYTPLTIRETETLTSNGLYI